MTGPILGFFGDYRFLSNFHQAPIQWRGFTFPTTENAYQAAKLARWDNDAFLRFVHCTASEAKRLSHSILVRPDWMEVNLPIMHEINVLKYTQHPQLGERLRQTGDRTLIEVNWWHDNFYGECRGSRDYVLTGKADKLLCPRCSGGENYLGRILMLIREEIS